MRTTERTGAVPHTDGPTVAIVVDLCDYALPHLDEPADGGELT